VSGSRSVAGTTGHAPTANPFRQPKAVYAVAFCLAPYCAARLAAALDVHVPFYLGAAAVALAIGVLATGHRQLSRAEQDMRAPRPVRADRELAAAELAGGSAGPPAGERQHAGAAQARHRGPQLGHLAGEVGDAARVLVGRPALGDLADPGDLAVQRLETP
jgi:hypothetical protein